MSSTYPGISRLHSPFSTIIQHLALQPISPRRHPSSQQPFELSYFLDNRRRHPFVLLYFLDNRRRHPFVLLYFLDNRRRHPFVLLYFLDKSINRRLAAIGDSALVQVIRIAGQLTV